MTDFDNERAKQTGDEVARQLQAMVAAAVMPKAKPVEFATEREPWNVYALADGTTLKLRLVVTAVRRVEGRADYQYDFQIVHAIDLPAA